MEWHMPVVCIPVEADFSRAFVLKHKVKLFRNKDDSSYISGRPGRYYGSAK